MNHHPHIHAVAVVNIILIRTFFGNNNGTGVGFTVCCILVGLFGSFSRDFLDEQIANMRIHFMRKPPIKWGHHNNQPWAPKNPLNFKIRFLLSWVEFDLIRIHLHPIYLYVYNMRREWGAFHHVGFQTRIEQLDYLKLTWKLPGLAFSNKTNIFQLKQVWAVSLTENAPSMQFQHSILEP